MIESFGIRLMLWVVLGFIWGRMIGPLGLGLVPGLVIFLVVIFPIVFVLVTPGVWQRIKEKFSKDEAEPE